MGKERIIAETGASQHGTATAMACAHLGMPCEIYMGETDIARQRPNVFRMRINGAEVNPVTTGRGTPQEAISETMRDWATTVETTHYVIGSVVGPAPFPAMVRDFQAVISEEAREQAQEKIGDLPDSVLACAGGGSNTMGTFANFVDDSDVALYAVEAGGSSLSVDEEKGVAPNSASLSTGDEGVLHGARTKLLQDSHGQIMESHSAFRRALTTPASGRNWLTSSTRSECRPSTSTTTRRWTPSTASRRRRDHPRAGVESRARFPPRAPRRTR